MIFEFKNILNQPPINFFIKGKLNFTGQDFTKYLFFESDLDWQNETKKLLKERYNIYVLNFDVGENFITIHYSRLFHSKIDLNQDDFIKILNKASDLLLRTHMLLFGTTGTGKMTEFMASMNQ